jgi:hypothetical protein
MADFNLDANIGCEPVLFRSRLDIGEERGAIAADRVQLTWIK